MLDDEQLRARLRELRDDPAPVPDEHKLDEAMRRGKRKLFGRRATAALGVMVVIGGIGAVTATLPGGGSTPEQAMPATGLTTERSTAAAESTPETETVRPTRSGAACVDKRHPSLPPPSGLDARNSHQALPGQYPDDLAAIVRDVAPDATVTRTTDQKVTAKIRTPAGRGSVRLDIVGLGEAPPDGQWTSTTITHETPTTVRKAPSRDAAGYRAAGTYRVVLRASNDVFYMVTVNRAEARTPTRERAQYCAKPLLSHEQLLTIARRVMKS